MGSEETLPRILGDRGSSKDGPTLLVTAGLHGNEPASIVAVQKVLRSLQEGDTPLFGRLIALSGNIPGLAARQRFIDEDLNRIWIDDRVSELMQGRNPRTREEGQLLELMPTIDSVFAEASCPEDVVALDLHSTSGPGLPFLISAEEPRPEFLSALPLPEILGMEELLIGTAMSYLAGRGARSFAVEGGQNDDPATELVHEALLWVLMAELGLVSQEAADEQARKTNWLKDLTAAAPEQLVVEYRHEIHEDDEFVMEPGYANLDLVKKGEVIARDVNREWKAGSDAWILFPLYQGQGEDGFFLAREPADFDF